MNYNLILKRYSLALLLLVFTTYSAKADTVNTKTLKQQSISFSVQQATLEDVFNQLSTTTGYHFLYDQSVLEVVSNVTLQVNGGSIEDVLRELTSKTGLKFKKSDNTISVTKEQPVVNKANQSKKITGIVVDGNGEPVIGVNIVEKGATNGTITDIDGNFSLDGVPENATLLVSFIGYLPQELSVRNRTSFNILLKEDNQLLDEVVVVGYGVQRKRDLTGAVSSVKMDDAPVGTFSSAAHALAGKAAGLRVTQNTAQPGAGTSFRIRGETSINASNDPLVIIDGFPVSSSSSLQSGNRYNAGSQDNVMEMINPNDIESIEILKDASATAIYGSRAGNGVIIITTKRGKVGKPAVTYSGNMAVQTMSANYKMLDAGEWMRANNMYHQERWRRSAGAGVYADYVTPVDNLGPYTPAFSEADIANAKTTDWMDEITRTGFQQSHNVSVTGGTEKSKYLASLNYFDQKGVLKNSNMKRYTANFNSDYELSRYIKAGLSFNLSRNTYDNVPLGTGENEYSGIIAAAAFFDPNLPIKDEDGNYTESQIYNQRPNPVSLLEITDNTTKDRVLGTGFVSVEPIKGLIFRANMGFDRKSAKRKTYLPTSTFFGARTNGQAYQIQNDGMDYLFNLTANYLKTIGKHNLTALVGYEWQQFTEEWFSAGNTNYSIDSFIYNNLGAGSGDKSVGSNAKKKSMTSVFGRINYSYDDKYLLTATLRADGASNFHKDNRWGYFPSVSAGWRFSEEAFMKNINHILSNGKIRAGYGQTGNSDIGNYTENYFRAERKYSFGGKGSTGTWVSSLGNPDITWETTKEWNIGVDLGFLDNRINVTAEYYDRTVSNLLVKDKRIPAHNEITKIAANAGSTQSQGFEITINTVNIKNKDWVWTTDLTLYRYKDRWKTRDGNWIPEAYQSLNDPIRAIYAYRSDGLLLPGEAVPAWQPGLLPGQIKLKNLSQEGVENVLDSYDQELIGTRDPALSFGLNNTVRYKKFDLNVYLYGEIGRWRDGSYYDTWVPYCYTSSDVGLTNMSQNIFNSWTMDNQNTSSPNLISSTYDSGDYFMKKVSYLRCRNITLGYTIPEVKTVFSNIRVYVSVNNPFTITNWNGLDPETDYNPSDFDGDNVGAYSYPNVRTFSIGLDIKF